MMRTPVPHDRRDHVRPGDELRCEVDRLVPPVRCIGALGSRGDLDAIDVEPVAVVGRDVHDEASRLCREIEDAPRVKYTEGIRGHPWGRDPAGLGRSGEDSGRVRPLSGCVEEREEREERGRAREKGRPSAEQGCTHAANVPTLAQVRQSWRQCSGLYPSPRTNNMLRRAPPITPCTTLT